MHITVTTSPGASRLSMRRSSRRSARLLLIPGEVARESGMMSPTNPI
jgi:hypothetical protein